MSVIRYLLRTLSWDELIVLILLLAAPAVLGTWVYYVREFVLELWRIVR